MSGREIIDGLQDVLDGRFIIVRSPLAKGWLYSTSSNDAGFLARMPNAGAGSTNTTPRAPARKRRAIVCKEGSGEMGDQDIDDLRRIAAYEIDAEDRARLREIADEYERMKHDLERHVEIAATIGDVEEDAYRRGWLDGCREGLGLAFDSHLMLHPAKINERLKRWKSE